MNFKIVVSVSLSSSSRILYLSELGTLYFLTLFCDSLGILVSWVLTGLHLSLPILRKLGIQDLIFPIGFGLKSALL